MRTTGSCDAQTRHRHSLSELTSEIAAADNLSNVTDILDKFLARDTGPLAAATDFIRHTAAQAIKTAPPEVRSAISIKSEQALARILDVGPELTALQETLRRLAAGERRHRHADLATPPRQGQHPLHSAALRAVPPPEPPARTP